MRQQLATVEHYNNREFEQQVNKLLEDGYILKNTNIYQFRPGTIESSGMYQAILIKEIEE